MDYDQQRKQLVEGLRLVAAPWDQQTAAMPDFVLVADELGSTFYDGYLLLPQLLKKKLVSENAGMAISRVKEWFDQMPRDRTLTPVETLKTDESWERARELAREALNELDEETGPPDLSHISWTK